MMQLKKIGLMTMVLVVSSLALSGCSVKEKLQNMMGPTQNNEMKIETSISPAVMSDDVMKESVSPEPTQSKSNEVKDLELDLKAVKFDEESFE